MTRHDRKRFSWPGALAALIVLAAVAWAPAALAEGPKLSRGQTVYIPAYAYVYLNEKGRHFNLTTTLLVHNTDPEHPISLVSVKYYDGKGKLVKEYAAKPCTLAPLEAEEVLVKGPPRNRGSGSCFVVKWSSAKPVSPPLMECVMISAQGQQGISYRSTGRVIR